MYRTVVRQAAMAAAESAAERGAARLAEVRQAVADILSSRAFAADEVGVAFQRNYTPAAEACGNGAISVVEGLASGHAAAVESLDTLRRADDGAARTLGDVRIDVH